MTETSHMPWFIVEYGDGDSLVIHSDDENRVCFMATHGGSRAAWERIQANAELIVRAVNAHRDLVEAVMAWSDVIAERRRQMEQEGYTPAHDDEHDRDHALARAAACYALAGTDAGSGPFWITHLQTPKQVWPYRWEWKPSDRRRNLVKAAALLLAEIERIDRAAIAKAEVPHG